MAKITVAIPEGTVGLVFTGSSTPILSRVKEDGPMAGKSVKPGYIVDSLILGSGKTMAGLSKIELITKLKETADDPNRKIIFEIAYKKGGIEVDIPTGKATNLGLVIAEKKGFPTVTNMSADCPIKGKISRGMLVGSVSSDTFSMTGYTSEDINAFLNSTSTLTTRKMIFMSPEDPPKEKSIDYEEKVIELPSGRGLGIKLGGNVATVLSIEPSSPLAGFLFPGMAITAVRIADGREFHGLSGSILYKVLQETMYTEGRQLYCPPPGTEIGTDVTLKFFPPMLGQTAEELGCKFESDGEALKLVDSYGSAFDVVPKGVIMTAFAFKSAVSSEEKVFTPSSAEELDAMLLDSSGCARHFIFAGVDSAYMPDEVTVMVPPGKIGAVFKGVPATLVKVKEESPLNQTAAVPGMVVAAVTIDGKTESNPATKTLTALLSKNPDAQRSIKFVNPKTF